MYLFMDCNILNNEVKCSICTTLFKSLQFIKYAPVVLGMVKRTQNGGLCLGIHKESFFF